MPTAAKVLIDGPSELVFDYALPEDASVQAGCRVRVPLRSRDATGTVLAVCWRRYGRDTSDSSQEKGQSTQDPQLDENAKTG